MSQTISIRRSGGIVAQKSRSKAPSSFWPRKTRLMPRIRSSRRLGFCKSRTLPDHVQLGEGATSFIPSHLSVAHVGDKLWSICEDPVLKSLFINPDESGHRLPVSSDQR